MARDADGRAQVHLANVQKAQRRGRRGILGVRAASRTSVPQDGVVSVETRGRRSISQRTRDTAEQLRGISTIFEGSPKLLETAFTAGFVGLVTYLLRPHVRIFLAAPGTTGVFWGGKEVSRVEITYPDRSTALNLSVLIGVLAAGGSGDLGSLLAPAAAAGLFHKFVDVEFDPNPQVYPAYDLRVLTWPGQPSRVPYSDQPKVTPYDARGDFYLKAIVPRVLLALTVAFLFYFVLRYIRHVGQ